MEMSVRTGRTKAKRGTALVSRVLKSAQGEDVYFLMQIEGKTEETKALEGGCLDILQHALLETEGDAPRRLDGTLKEMNGLLKGLALSQGLSDGNLLIAVLDKDGVLHVSHAGRSEAYLVRGGTASQITEFTRGKPDPFFVHIASGKLEPRDTAILTTERLLRTVTPAQLAQLSAHEDRMLPELQSVLEAEGEEAALISLHAPGGASAAREVSSGFRGGASRRRSGSKPALSFAFSLSFLRSALPFFNTITSRATDAVSNVRWVGNLRSRVARLISDLGQPRQRHRSHLFLLAGAVALLLVIWAVVHLSISSQRSKTRTELAALVEQINAEIRTADNRQLAGDTDAANAILNRAEERAKQVMDNEGGLFRVEALDLLDRIRSKKEGINNISRLSPRVVVNLTGKNANVVAQGFVGLGESEFIVYDRQDLYRVLLNSVDDPDRLSEDELIVDATAFPRFQTVVFLTTENGLMEFASGQASSMKTEDPAGWIAGKDIEAYLRYLYVLSPENKQIYKYERLSNRYSSPAPYNVNGDLTDALDMTIDTNIYVLREGGDIVKLFRGETQPFVIRRLPEGSLKDAKKVFKVFDGNFYFLDPSHRRVIVSSDGGAAGESTYVKQYILEGEQIGELQDLYVDPDQTRLHVMDEKRVYVIDLAAK